MAERAPDVLLPIPLLVAEFGGYFALPPGSLLADMDGDVEEEEWMPFVIIPGGLLTFAETDCDTGAMIPQSASRYPPTLSKAILCSHILVVR